MAIDGIHEVGPILDRDRRRLVDPGPSRGLAVDEADVIVDRLDRRTRGDCHPLLYAVSGDVVELVGLEDVERGGERLFVLLVTVLGERRDARGMCREPGQVSPDCDDRGALRVVLLARDRPGVGPVGWGAGVAIGGRDGDVEGCLELGLTEGLPPGLDPNVIVTGDMDAAEAVAASLVLPPLPGAPPGRTRPRRPRAGLRPTECHRVLQLRRPELLRHRECLGDHAARTSAPLAATRRRFRSGRLPLPRRQPSASQRPTRRRCAAPRPRGPGTRRTPTPPPPLTRRVDPAWQGRPQMGHLTAAQRPNGPVAT